MQITFDKAIEPESDKNVFEEKKRNEIALITVIITRLTKNSSRLLPTTINFFEGEQYSNIHENVQFWEVTL